MNKKHNPRRRRPARTAGKRVSSCTRGPLSEEELRLIDAYWRAANYLSVGQIYLYDNPLLRQPLSIEHVKPRLLGHWGTTPGLNFLYVHMQFSFPGGIPSHAAPETPGSIHEGGELGYALSHAFGAAFDNPELIVACVVGDGEAETGPLAAAWHSNKFLNPATDGAVLPILHLNGYKIANPTVLARIDRWELESLLRGFGYEPRFVEGPAPSGERSEIHQDMAAALDEVIEEIRGIQSKARAAHRAGKMVRRPRWPMIVLKTPKGWTGPKEVDGKRTEGCWRSHQVPFAELAENPGHLKLLEQWLRSYRPEELFDSFGRLLPELRALAPKGRRRKGDNPHANGGILLRDLRIPDFRSYAVDVPKPGVSLGEATRTLGAFLRDIVRANPDNFLVFGPDETASNRLGALLEATSRRWVAETLPEDADGGKLSPEGRVLEILSEHTCQGWLEGYLLTSHVWRQDHNGFSHQDPGFIDHVLNKKGDVIRVYLPPDANTLLSVADHCLRSRNYINVIAAGNQPALQYLDMDAAVKHCLKGVDVWPWAGSEEVGEPDVVLACAGDVPTLETLAAADLLRRHLLQLLMRVVNVLDLAKLQPPEEHPHGLSGEEFDRLFIRSRPIIFAYHGYPWLIHRLTYRRTNHGNLHVRGYKEEGTTTTPFDMVVLNDLDRYHRVNDVIARVPGLAEQASPVRALMQEKLAEHRRWIERYGEDMPEMRDWVWPG